MVVSSSDAVLCITLFCHYQELGWDYDSVLRFVHEVHEMASKYARQISLEGRDISRFFFINSHYQPFSAADWDSLPSGLLGLVSIRPLSYTAD